MVRSYWGVGWHRHDIIKASIQCTGRCSQSNSCHRIQSVEEFMDERLMEMMNYMQTNYQTVTLEDMAKQFHLSEPYISKYIKEKSGKTFVEQVDRVSA